MEGKGKFFILAHEGIDNDNEGNEDGLYELQSLAVL